MSYKTKSVLVYDLGLFCGLAETLTSEFGKVYYHSPGIEAAFPKSNWTMIGRGIPGVTRVESIWDVLDDVDLFVFTDVGSGPLQCHLREIGKRVWGAGMAEELELDRAASKKHLEKLGIPIGEWAKVRGVDALRGYLSRRKNQWVKVSRFRGDMESFHAASAKTVASKLDELDHNLGAKSDLQEFIVEKHIGNAVEIAYDGFTVDGEYPKKALFGAEIKDKGYVGTWLDYDKLPSQIQETNALIAPTLKKYECRSFFGMEMRVDKAGKPWVIDPLCRLGSPPGELCQVMYKNLAEIFWEGAGGKVVTPEFAAKWGAELLIHSSWAEQHWQPITFPKDIEKYVKLRNMTIIDGERYVVPQTVGLPEVGAVTGIGATMEEAIAQVKEHAEQIDGYLVEIFEDSIDKAKGEFDKMKEYGIDI